jgi:hypothetical protein
MGGYNSGRHGARPAIDSGRVLDLGALKRDGRLCSGQGSVYWRNVDTDEVVGSIGYQIWFEDETLGWVRLQYVSTTWDGEKHHSDYRVGLISTPQPFGGRRWWLTCPRTGARAQKLYMPAGSFTFMSRRAYRGRGYRSQRRSPYDQAIAQAYKLRRRLGDDGEIDDPIWKPKWMRKRTFERKAEQIEVVEERVNERLAYFAYRLLKLDHR